MFLVKIFFYDSCTFFVLTTKQVLFFISSIFYWIKIKDIAKLLSLRLRKVINEVINDFYSAFIAKRQILDRSILPNEIRDSMQRKHEQGFLFKVGFQKAFDLVTWGFIFEVMDSSIVNGFFRFGNVYL